MYISLEAAWFYDYTFESVITNTSLFIFGGGEADEHNNDDNNN